MTDVIDVVMAGIGPPGDLEGEVGGDLQGTISSASIKPGAVTTSKLADGAVTAAKVAPDVATQVELDAVTDDLASEAADRAAADALLIPLAQRGAANGVATLGADSKIPGAQLPALAIGETFTAASQAAMLALTAQRGDVAVRTDLDPDGFFLLTADDPAILGNWVQITAPGAVTSVEGMTGAIDLSGIYAETPAGAPATALVLDGPEQAVTKPVTFGGHVSFSSGRPWVDAGPPSGGADDTAVVQPRGNLATTLGVPLVFSNGIYRLENLTLSNAEAIELRGQPGSTTLKLRDDDGQGGLGQILRTVDCIAVTMRHLHCHGNYANAKAGANGRPLVEVTSTVATNGRKDFRFVGEDLRFTESAKGWGHLRVGIYENSSTTFSEWAYVRIDGYQGEAYGTSATGCAVRGPARLIEVANFTIRNDGEFGQVTKGVPTTGSPGKALSFTAEVPYGHYIREARLSNIHLYRTLGFFSQALKTLNADGGKIEGTGINPYYDVAPVPFTADPATDVISATVPAGYGNSSVVRFRSTGTLPAPLVAGQFYFVRFVAGNTFKAATQDTNGSVVNITDTGTGTHEVEFMGMLYTASIKGDDNYTTGVEYYTGQAPTTFTADASTDRVTVVGGPTDRAAAFFTLSTTGMLPAPLRTGVRYNFMLQSGDTFKLGTEPGGSTIDITDAGSGVHSINWVGFRKIGGTTDYGFHPCVHTWRRLDIVETTPHSAASNVTWEDTTTTGTDGKGLVGEINFVDCTFDGQVEISKSHPGIIHKLTRCKFRNRPNVAESGTPLQINGGVVTDCEFEANVTLTPSRDLTLVRPRFQKGLTLSSSANCTIVVEDAVMNLLDQTMAWLTINPPITGVSLTVILRGVRRPFGATQVTRLRVASVGDIAGLRIITEDSDLELDENVGQANSSALKWSGTGNFNKRGTAFSPLTLANSATPSISQGDTYETGGTTRITNFSGGIDKTQITVFIALGHTVGHTATIQTRTATDLAGPTVARFVRSGGVWYQP